MHRPLAGSNPAVSAPSPGIPLESRGFVRARAACAGPGAGSVRVCGVKGHNVLVVWRLVGYRTKRVGFIGDRVSKLLAPSPF